MWSQEEMEVVREKMTEMMDLSNWRGTFLSDGTFSTDGSTAFSLDDKYCWDCLWGKKDTDKGQVPQPSKLLRLSFHDCVPYLDDEGNPVGGCDGCLNWSGMGFGYSGFPGGPQVRDYYPVFKGDNNGLQTTVAALEMIYKDKSWPSTAPALNQSLWETGKSRADLWQFGAKVALELEIERANFGCDYDYNTGNQVRLLESKEKCYFKLFKPSVFKFGRIDCIPDEAKKVTDFPYEATEPESHANTYGSAKHVVDNLKQDFNLTAREGISLMAAHATSGQQHSFRLPTKYMWPGNPYLSNMYFKYLAGTGHYRRYKGLKPSFPTSVGDSQGRPNMGSLWKMGCTQTWKSNMTDRAGPCFWRPTNSGCNRPDEETSKSCFDHFAEDGTVVLKSGRKDKNNLCQNITIDANRIQHGGVPNVNSGKQGCGTELTFALTYEVNFMNEFQMDELSRPHGCIVHGESTVNCPPNMEQYENGEALSEITMAFGEDHDVWNQAFMEGWDKMVENGYTEDQLVAGPEYSWLGYSYFDSGSYGDVSYPLVFTDSKKAKPTIGNVQTENLRDNCLRYFPDQCPPEFKRDHEDYYIGRLESPWGCQEEGSTLDSIPFHIKNVKDGKMLQIESETGNFEVAQPNEADSQKWIFKTSCEGGVVLTNMATSTTSTWTFNPVTKTLWNEAQQALLGTPRGRGSAGILMFYM